MSGCQYQSRLGAYHDGELDDSASQAVERHLAECEICAAELAGLREVSQAMAGFDPGEITPLELARLHRELDRADEGSVLRFGVGLAAAAASILIISLAWIGQTAARPAQQTNSQFQPVQQLPEWQRLAFLMPLRPFACRLSCRTSPYSEGSWRHRDGRGLEPSP